MENNTTDAILFEIKAERARQTEKYGVQRHTPERWLAIAVEEIGELAQAMQVGSIAHKDTDASNMLEEAIQGAAVLVAFSEQLVEQMAAFEPCSTCTDLEFCVTQGRLCDGPTIGDPVDDETKKI